MNTDLLTSQHGAEQQKRLIEAMQDRARLASLIDKANMARAAWGERGVELPKGLAETITFLITHLDAAEDDARNSRVAAEAQRRQIIGLKDQVSQMSGLLNKPVLAQFDEEGKGRELRVRDAEEIVKLKMNELVAAEADAQSCREELVEAYRLRDTKIVVRSVLLTRADGQESINCLVENVRSELKDRTREVDVEVSL